MVLVAKVLGWNGGECKEQNPWPIFPKRKPPPPLETTLGGIGVHHAMVVHPWPLEHPLPPCTVEYNAVSDAGFLSQSVNPHTLFSSDHAEVGDFLVRCYAHLWTSLGWIWNDRDCPSWWLDHPRWQIVLYITCGFAQHGIVLIVRLTPLQSLFTCLICQTRGIDCIARSCTRKS